MRVLRLFRASGIIKHKHNWSEEQAECTLTRLEKNVFPWLGGKNVNDISAPELLTILRRIENRGALDTAQRTHQQCSQVFRYAVATDIAERDFSYELKGALPPAKKQNITLH